MDAIRSVSVRVEYVDHDSGHWCNRCQLSTGSRIWVAVSHLARLHLQARLHCYDCGGHDITVADS